MARSLLMRPKSCCVRVISAPVIAGGGPYGEFPDPPGIVLGGVDCGGAVVGVGKGFVPVGVVPGCVGTALCTELGFDFGVGVTCCMGMTICGVAVGNLFPFKLLENTCGGGDECPC